MSLLQTLINQGLVIFCFRYTEGTITDKAGNYIPTKSGTVVLKNDCLNCDFSSSVNIGEINVGTSDFTILASQNPKQYNSHCLQNTAGTVFNFSITGSGSLSLLLDGVYFNKSSVGSVATGKFNQIAVSADRDGNAEYFAEGISYGTVDISSKASANFVSTVQSPFNFASRKSDFKYLCFIKKSLTATEVAQLASELNSTPDQRVDSKAIVWNPVVEYNCEYVRYKGEMHALANERTLSSGYIENTKLRIDSGSVKLITTSLNGYECRAVECVTNSDIFVDIGTETTEDWVRTIDGTTYATTLSSANTISLTAGQVLIYASKNPSYSLHNKFDRVNTDLKLIEKFASEAAIIANGGTLTDITLPGGGVAEFNGSTSNIVYSESIDDVNLIVVSGWIYPETFTSNSRFVCKGTTSNQDFMVSGLSGRLRIFAKDHTGVNKDTDFALDTLTLNAWNYIVAVIDGEHNLLKGSVNNQPFISVTSGGVFNGNSLFGNSGKSLSIGARESGTAGDFFEGKMKDIRVFGYIPTNKEIG